MLAGSLDGVKCQMGRGREREREGESVGDSLRGKDGKTESERQSRVERKKKESEQFLSLTFVIRYEQEVKLSISLLLFYVLQVTLFLCFTSVS